MLLWLRGETPKNSWLRDVCDFIAHPYRDRGPTSDLMSDLALHLEKNFGEGFKSQDFMALLNERAISSAEVYLGFRDVLLTTGLISPADDERLAVVYEAFMLFTLAALHQTSVSAPGGFSFDLQIGTFANGILGIFSVFQLGTNSGAYLFTVPIMSTNLLAKDWIEPNAINGPIQFVATPAPRLIAL